MNLSTGNKREPTVDKKLEMIMVTYKNITNEA